MDTGKHPFLAKKLSRLYVTCANPAVNNNASLAKHLGISRQAISKWVHGSETSAGNCIPLSKVHEVAEVFGLEPHHFSLDLDEFGRRLQQKLEPAHAHSHSKIISLSSLPITRLDLVGRNVELELLDRVWEEQRTNCVEIIAFGGTGKSSLVNSWLSGLSKRDYAGADRVYAWSFVSPGSDTDLIASGDLFIEQALDWFGDKHPAEGTPWAKANRLATLVRESKTIVVLDGLEPLQYPPGPKQGEIENPAVSFFLKEMASSNTGLCIITSRIPVKEFASYNDGRIRTLQLEELSGDAGATLLRDLGVRGDEADMQSAVEAYAGHPLCLSLLAGYVSVVCDSEIEQYRSLESLSTVQPFDGQASDIMHAYLHWFNSPRETCLLNLLGLFDRALSITDLELFVASTSIKGLTTDLQSMSRAEWRYALKKLEDVNLVTISPQNKSTVVDCHPLVRDFLSEHLRNNHPEIWQRGNEAVFSFLCDQALENPQNMLQLEPIFRAVVHGTRAGLYEESFDLYFEKIKRKQFSMFTEGSHHADQSCIRTFFKKPWIEPVPQLSESASSYLLSCAAANLIYLGHIEEAIDPSILSIQWFQFNERWFEAAATAGPLISMLLAAGRLSRAREEWENNQESVKKAGNIVLSAVNKSIEAYLCFLEGDNDKAGELFSESEKVITCGDPKCEVGCPTISAYYCKFLLDTGNVEEALERALLTVEWRESTAWQVSVDTTSLYATDLQMLGLIYLALNDRQRAKYYLDKQVEKFRDANEWLYLPSGLIARARLHLLNRNFKCSLQDLEEALSIARRTGAKYSEWESIITLAQLRLESEELESAKSYFKAAMTFDGIQSYEPCVQAMNSLRYRIYRT